MPPKTGGMGRINDIDSNDTSHYHPPNNQHDKIIISKSAQSLSSSVPQFCSRGYT